MWFYIDLMNMTMIFYLEIENNNRLLHYSITLHCVEDYNL